MQNNPMLNQLNNSPNQITPDLTQVKEMAQMIGNAKNPDAMIQYLMTSNPQFKDAMNFVRQNGGSPKDAFYALAKQRGVNPDEIISLLK